MQIPDFKLSTDRHGLPLIIWNNPPGLFAEFTPEQMRKLAQKLIYAADIAETKT